MVEKKNFSNLVKTFYVLKNFNKFQVESTKDIHIQAYHSQKAKVKDRFLDAVREK